MGVNTPKRLAGLLLGSKRALDQPALVLDVCLTSRNLVESVSGRAVAEDCPVPFAKENLRSRVGQLHANFTSRALALFAPIPKEWNTKQHNCQADGRPDRPYQNQIDENSRLRVIQEVVADGDKAMLAAAPKPAVKETHVLLPLQRPAGEPASAKEVKEAELTIMRS